MSVLRKNLLAIVFALSVASLSAQNEIFTDTETELAEIIENIALALEQEEIKKSQSTSSFAAHSNNQKPGGGNKEKLEALELIAKKLQSDYLEKIDHVDQRTTAEIDNINQRAALEKSELEKQYLKSLREINKQIKELRK